jgi:hypothetical protein
MHVRQFVLSGFSVLIPLVIAAESRANLIQNANFASYTTGSQGVGELNSYTTLANWTSGMNESNHQGTNLLFTNGLADTTGSWATDSNSYYKLCGPGDGIVNGLTATSPLGNNFVALDGDYRYRATLSQTLTTLVAGQTYLLTFDWAVAQQYDYNTATMNNSITASLGSQSFTTALVNNPAQGFTGWMSSSMTFTATSSQETLSFLASGPSGAPPYMLLADASLNAVPEPSSVALVALGTLSILGVQLRKRFGRLRQGKATPVSI